MALGHQRDRRGQVSDSIPNVIDSTARIVNTQVILRRRDVTMPQQLLHHIDVAGLVIQPLRKRFPQRMRRKLAVQARRNKRVFEYIVGGLPMQCHSAGVVARRK